MSDVRAKKLSERSDAAPRPRSLAVTLVKAVYFLLCVAFFAAYTVTVVMSREHPGRVAQWIRDIRGATADAHPSADRPAGRR